MFKFNNAFLTSNGGVAIQFFDHNRKAEDGQHGISTIYPDKEGKLHLDSNIKLEGKDLLHLHKQYNLRKGWYKK